MRAPRLLGRLLFLVLGLLISVLLLYLALRGLDLVALAVVWRQSRVSLLLLGTLLIALSLLLRAERWRGLVTTGGVALQAAFAANSVGYLGNLLLPARAGELFRSVILGRHSGLGTSHVLAASLSERVLDALTLVIVALLSLGTLSTLEVRRAAVLVAIGCLVVLAALIAAAQMSDRVLAWLAHVTLPERLRLRLLPLASRFLGGLAALRSGRRLRRFGFYTLLIWSLDGVTAVVLARAFQMALTWPQALLLLAILGLASAVPSAPGYVGVYQFVAVTMLVPLGYSQAQALVYVTAFQLVTYLVVLSCGIWALLKLNLRPAQLRALSHREVGVES